jgi:predicted Zn-dependent protease
MLKAATVRAFACLALLLCATGVQAESNGSGATRPVRDVRLEKIAAELSAALEMRKTIQVAIVPTNERVVSVEPFVSGEGYRVEIERAFLDQLDEEEIVAALAHEIGHVWIFSHRPHLQTEALANEIALKIVPRKQLENLYGKLWRYIGSTGNVMDLLGTEKNPKNNGN